MPRPYIPGVQHQDLPIQQAPMAPDRPETTVGMTVLSFDPESRASSGLVQIPPDWRAPGVSYIAVDQELYVLSGQVTMSGERYTAGSYAFLPAGYPLVDGTTAGGAEVLYFTGGWAELLPGEAPPGLFNGDRLIRHRRLIGEPWSGSFPPDAENDNGRVWLKRDPLTGDETWLREDLPLLTRGRSCKHPVAEEIVVLAGALTGPHGALGPGGYVWHPADFWHGPIDAKEGSLLLYRSIGGPISTTYDPPATGAPTLGRDGGPSAV